MSRFRKLSQTIWHCQYHILWTPKYRYRVMAGGIAEEADTSIRTHTGRLICEIVELNVRLDHVHVLVMVPPKRSISDYVGIVKGRTAIRILNKFRHLKEKPYWGNHFWTRGYCVETVGLDSEMIRKYVKYQEAKERRDEEKEGTLF